MTACHSAIWDPDIVFNDTFTALGLANQLRGEVILTNDFENASPPGDFHHRPSCLLSVWKPSSGRIKFNDIVIAIHDDRSIEVEALSDASSDEHSLMARAPYLRDSPITSGTDCDLGIHTPSSPHCYAGRLWRSVQVFDMHSNHARGRVQVEPPEAIFAEVRRLLGYTHYEVAEIFDIIPPPQDLDFVHVRPLLLLRHDDLYFGDDRRAVLFDVDLHGDLPDSIIETDRYTTFLPAAVHRSFLLRIAGVKSYCASQSNRCLVWHRGHLLPFQSNGLVHLQHGDYIRIAVPLFVDPAVPTHFAVRACQAGLTHDQLVNHFHVHGPDADSFHTDVASAAEEVASFENEEALASIENLNRMFDAVQE